jgi:hypothetical protein
MEKENKKSEGIIKNLVGKFRSTAFNDDEGSLSKKDKFELEKMIKERRLELIAQKKLRDLEKRYAPENKKNMSDVFENIKKYRQENLSKRQQRMSINEEKKRRYEQIEENLKKGRSTNGKSLSNVGDRIKMLDNKRRERLYRK